MTCPAVIPAMNCASTSPVRGRGGAGRCPGQSLASVPGRALVSNGNFHPVVLAIAYDALRIALCGPWCW